MHRPPARSLHCPHARLSLPPIRSHRRAVRSLPRARGLTANSDLQATVQRLQSQGVVSAEIEQFLAAPSADKRARKIDELLERPAYAAWWANRLGDFTGNKRK